MKQTIIFLLTCLSFFIILLSCDKRKCVGCDPTCHTTIDKNIKPLDNNKDPQIGRIAVWRTEKEIYCIDSKLHRLRLDDDYQILEDSNLVDFYTTNSNGAVYLQQHRNDPKLLIVTNRKSLFKNNQNNVFRGALSEYDIATGSLTELLDSSNLVASANYYLDSEHVIYYAYNDLNENVPGFYIFDKIVGESTLLIPYKHEYDDHAHRITLSGFDVHPTRNKVLLPLIQDSTNWVAVEYDLDENKAKTLNLSFPLEGYIARFWLRYNNAGSEILYSCTLKENYSAQAGGFSEVGIFNIASGSKRTFNVNTNPYCRSYNEVPVWSPNEDKFLYWSQFSLPSEERVGPTKFYINSLN